MIIEFPNLKNLYVTHISDYNNWLLSEEVDILPHLLLPLAGPEELKQEETDCLPLDLQYLGEDKVREPEPDLRIMLIESLMQVFMYI